MIPKSTGCSFSDIHNDSVHLTYNKTKQKKKPKQPQRSNLRNRQQQLQSPGAAEHVPGQQQQKQHHAQAGAEVAEAPLLRSEAKGDAWSGPPRSSTGSLGAQGQAEQLQPRLMDGFWV